MLYVNTVDWKTLLANEVFLEPAKIQAGNAAFGFANAMIDKQGVMLLTGAGLRAVAGELCTRTVQGLRSLGMLSAEEMVESVERNVNAQSAEDTEAPEQEHPWYLRKLEVPTYALVVAPLWAMTRIQDVFKLVLFK